MTMPDNNNKPLVSVVVPVYKVEQYLARCVESIQNQTIQDIEIILVDDGSPDQCGAMCDQLAEADSRIKVIHKTNGGLSDARNCGTAQAGANYVVFIDSDDYIDEDMVERLYSDVTKEGADLATCGIYHHYEHGMETLKDSTGRFVVDTKEAVRKELVDVNVSAVNKIYKKTLFEKVQFPKGKFYEDAHTIIPLLLQTKRVVINMHPSYHYIHREGSITTKPYYPGMLHLIEANANNLELVSKAYPDLTEEAEYRAFWAYYYVLDKMEISSDLTNLDKKEKRRIVSYLRKHTFKIIKNRFFLKTRKIAACVLLLSEPVYRYFVNRIVNKNYDNIH